MLSLPQRRASPTRDEFAAAVTASFEELWGLYQAEPRLEIAPDWAVGALSVALPIAVARQGGEPHGVASIVKHAIEMRKRSIDRIARVERDGQWIVFFEVS